MSETTEEQAFADDYSNALRKPEIGPTFTREEAVGILPVIAGPEKVDAWDFVDEMSGDEELTHDSNGKA